MKLRRRELTIGALALVAAPSWAAVEEASFLDQLRAESTAPLAQSDFEAAAEALGASRQAVQAIVEVESARGGGFDPSGRPKILFERHIFSRRTNRRFDTSHTTISQPAWSRDAYPPAGDARWAQLAEAYALDADAALQATSWGVFQMLGTNFADAGYPDAAAFVRDMSRSHARQLAAWTQWVRTRGMADEVQRLDWAGFARLYNGPAAASQGYDQRMAAAYARLTASE